MNRTPQELALELLRRLNEGDVDGATALFGEDAELCFPRFAPRAVYRGGPQLREFLAWLTEHIPVQTFAADRVAAGPESATVEFETTGLSATGQTFDGSGALVIDVAGGLITAVRAYVDTADLQRVLGVPASAA